MILEELMILPIYKRNRDKYYADHDRYFKKEITEVEKVRGESFSELDRSEKFFYENAFFWPPWKFNDLVGFVDLGTDRGNCIAADLFIKRKYIPKNHHNKRVGTSGTIANNQFYYYCEVTKTPVDIQNNMSIISGIVEILEDAKEILKNIRSPFFLPLPPYGLDCFDFTKMIQRIRNEEE